MYDSFLSNGNGDTQIVCNPDCHRLDNTMLLLQFLGQNCVTCSSRFLYNESRYCYSAAGVHV